jgi:hypothetical protein
MHAAAARLCAAELSYNVLDNMYLLNLQTAVVVTFATRYVTISVR